MNLIDIKILIKTLANLFENNYNNCCANLQPGTYSPVVSFSGIFSIN